MPVNGITEEILEGYTLKDTRVTEGSLRLHAQEHARKWVAEESLEDYALKDIPVNELQRKDRPVNGVTEES